MASKNGKEKAQRGIWEEIAVDLFAGAAGAGLGVRSALGRQIDVAVNHDPIALAVYKANNPWTRILEADLWDVKPLEATRGRPVGILWASPDCTHFSVAKGGTPKKQEIRSLAWVVARWVAEVRPRIVCVENVAEFRSWGPLGHDRKPIKARMGETFRRWCARLEKLGYVVDHRVLDASHYGAPTKRRRVFIVARRDGQPIRWPEPTHGPGLLPYKTAADCIDWSIPCPSIFERERPLADKTLWRIAEGIRRFVLESPQPFIIKVNHGKWEPRGSSIDEPLSTVTAKQRGHAIVTPTVISIDQQGSRHAEQSVEDPMSTIVAKNRHAIVAPTLIQTGYGEREGQAARVPGLHKPLGTMVNGQKHALVSAFMVKHFGGVVGFPMTDPTSTITAKDHHALAAVALAKFRGTHTNQPGSQAVDEPVPTISAGGTHVAEVRAFLTAYYGSDGTPGKGQDLSKPTRTLTAKSRLGLVTVEGTEYQIVDIGMRMLQPHELLRAQFGKFADGYDMSAAVTKSAQVRLIGNSVCPELAEALVRANYDKRDEDVAVA